MSARRRMDRAAFVDGMKLGVGPGAAAFVLALSFGAEAEARGWGFGLPVVFSALAFSGSAQFTLLTALAGGSALAAITSAVLINARYLVMSVALNESLEGGRVRRSLHALALADASFVAAHRDDGRYDAARLVGASVPQWIFWVGGTAIGALTSPSPELMHTLGLDVAFPAFFLDPRDRRTAEVAPGVRGGAARRDDRGTAAPGDDPGVRAARSDRRRADRRTAGEGGDRMIRIWLSVVAVTVLSWLMKASAPLIIAQRKLPRSGDQDDRADRAGAARRADRDRARRQGARLDAARRRRDVRRTGGGEGADAGRCRGWNRRDRGDQVAVAAISSMVRPLRIERGSVVVRSSERIGGLVADLDHQPVAIGAREGPRALEFHAVQPELQVPALDRLTGLDQLALLVAGEVRVDAGVPDDHRTAAVLGLGVHALVRRVLEDRGRW